MTNKRLSHFLVPLLF